MTEPRETGNPDLLDTVMDAFHVAFGYRMNLTDDERRRWSGALRASVPADRHGQHPPSDPHEAAAPWLSDLWVLAHRRDLPPDVQDQIERDVKHIRAVLRAARGGSPDPQEPSDDIVSLAKKHLYVYADGSGRPYYVAGWDDFAAALRASSRSGRPPEVPKRSVPNPCSVCGVPIFGSFIGTGDGSMRDGGSFAHPECYWRKRASELEKELTALASTPPEDRKR